MAGLRTTHPFILRSGMLRAGSLQACSPAPGRRGA